MESILKMLPSVGPFAGLQQASKSVDESQFVRLEAIINSMTKKERANADIISGSRRKRIAAGSGTSVQDVNQLLRQYAQMSKMFKQMGTCKIALLVTNRSAAIVDMSFDSIPSFQDRVVCESHRTAETLYLCGRTFNYLSSRLVNNLEDLRQWAALGFFERPSGQGFGHWVHTGHQGLFICDNDAITDALQDSGSAHFALLEHP